MKNKKQSLLEYVETIVSFLKKYILKNKLNGFVLGLSGGIDSAVALMILLKAVKKEKITVLIMPCCSNEKDRILAEELCKKNSIKFEIIDLTKTFLTIVKEIEKNIILDENTKNNIKVRLRTCSLYAVAQQKKSIVIGTGNLDEIFTGFFTKFGDNACDVSILSELLKKEIYDIAKKLGVTKDIINRPPTSGLSNLTDEEELKVTYEEIDKYLLKKPIKESSKKIIEKLHKMSNHKRKYPVKAPKFER